MPQTVLITGAFGLVGPETVRRFAADGWHVVATAHCNVDAVLPPGVETRWVDVTDPEQVERLVSEVAPDAIVHLAAVIPPWIYRDPGLGRKVNVDATAMLVRAAEAQPKPPRFLHASSAAVYGSRNPYRHPEPVGVDSQLRPCELYGGQKLEAEEIVQSSSLNWVVLRLGGVISADPSTQPSSSDMVYFGSALPADGRVHCVDTRDVATAFASAAHADVVREILLIAGDDSHLLRQGDISRALAAAQGMPGVPPLGRPGNPDSDDDWFPSDWMDVGRAQQLLKFQDHSWPDLLADIRAYVGWKRYPMRLVAPVARQALKRQAAYHKAPGQYADVWRSLSVRFGQTSLDTAEPD
jgi:nucleoside-diphosphate-sugar epimerase